ncbi:MAG: TonB-dependent receptor [Pseudomonadales bacterium]|nr:TonB-dependent receptor [Pseudomonadales bacterium]
MKTSTASIAMSALCLCAANVAAEVARDNGDSWAIETIVVTAERTGIHEPVAQTATRTPTPVEKIPQSIQTLNRNLIEEQDLQNLPSALANVSGVAPSSPMQLVLQPTLVRGFAVSYYFDGLPSYQLPAGAADPGTLINVERIEVAKGPASTLFGGGAGAPLAGLINLISRDPVPEAAGSVAIRAGSFDTFGGAADINLPLTDQLAVRVNGMIEQADSFLDVVDSKQRAIFPSIAWTPCEDTRLVLRGRFNRSLQQEYAGLPSELVEPARLISRKVFAGASDAPETAVENNQIGAFLSHRLTDRIELNAAAGTYDGKIDEWSTFPFGQLAGTLYNFGNGLLTSDTDKVFATASITALLGDGAIRHQILSGIDWDDTDYKGSLSLNAFWAFLDYTAANPTATYGAPPPLFSDQRDKLSSTALFVQDQVSIGNRLDVTLGLRWTQLDITSNVSGFVTDDTDRRLTPRVGATFELLDGLSLFAGYARGFQGVVAAGFFGIEPKPETSTSWETGLKFASPIEGLTGTLALYQVERRNVITPDPVLPFVYGQSGEQRARGIEADLIYEPSPALSILASYAYTDAEVSRDNALPEGDRLRAVPRHSGRLAVRYRFAGTALEGLEIGAGVTAMSGRELTLPNTARVDGLVLADAQVAYDFGPAMLRVSVQNLFDRGGFEPYQYLGGAFVVPVQPRAAYLTLQTGSW